MKRFKLLFILAVVLITSTAYSQARIGVKYDSIKKEFKSLKSCVVKQGLEDDTHLPYITVKTDTKLYLYYKFNKKNVCYKTFIFFEDKAYIKYYVEFNNENYVIINDSHWRAYNNDIVYDCYLGKVEDSNSYYILWK